MTHETPFLSNTLSQLKRVTTPKIAGKISAVRGLLLECSGIASFMAIGDRCEVQAHTALICEVVGFDQDKALLMPFDSAEGVRLGAPVRVLGSGSAIFPDHSWLGRVVDAMGNAADDKTPLIQGAVPHLLRANPPPANRRARVEGKVDLGVQAINTFLSFCRWQRMGIFA